MKITSERTYRFGRLAVSLYGQDIVLIYSGKRSVHVKRIWKKTLSSICLRMAVCVAVLSGVLAASAIFSPSADEEPETAAAGDDEKIKNELLMSSSTDYTLPDEKYSLEVHTYRVKQGDTLSAIAVRFGVSLDTVCGSNNITSADNLPTGKLLTVPNRDGILYTMKKGSSIVAVAKKYKVSLEKILAANELKNADFIKTGRVLFIPDAKPDNIIKGFIWPTSGRFITCGYGWRPNPFSGTGREFHSGMDIRASYEWIKAVMYGKVTFAGWLGGYGKAVIIAHPGGWKTLYGHLSQISVKSGQYVKQGQFIARSGNTGRSTGPHLHFELLQNGKHQNPYVKLSRKK